MIAWFTANRSRSPMRTLAFWRRRTPFAELQPGDARFYSARLDRGGELSSQPRVSAPHAESLIVNSICWPSGHLPAGTVLRASVFNSGKIAQVAIVAVVVQCSDRRRYPCLLMPEEISR